MSKKVQRFVIRVKPERNHPHYHEWQTGTVCLFVGEDDRARAQELAEQELEQRRWQRIQYLERATLVESRVCESGEEVWNAYLRARSGQIVGIEALDRIPFRRKGEQSSIVAPRLTEAFIDIVIERVGGRRLTDEEANFRKVPNADYRVGHFILELKDLQTESLEIRTRQQKVAELLRTHVRSDRSLVIDLSSLSEDEFTAYTEIVGVPIRKRLHSARDQVRATLDHLSNSEPSLRGGAILLNSGYGTMPHRLLYDLAKSYVERSRTLQFVICVSCWCLTDGFDTTVQFAFDPHEGDLQPIAAIRGAFWSSVESMMNDWARNGCRAQGSELEPLRPLVFEDAGDSFSLIPPQPPSTLNAEDRERKK